MSYLPTDTGGLVIIIICVFCKRENQGADLDGELKLKALKLKAEAALHPPCLQPAAVSLLLVLTAPIQEAQKKAGMDSEAG